MIVIEMITIVVLFLCLFLPRKILSRAHIDVFGNIIIGISAATLGYMFGFSDAIGQTISEFIKYWEVLIGSIVTICAGYLAYYAALSPHRDRAHQEKEAAKAALAMLLSDMLDEVDNTYRKLDYDIKSMQRNDRIAAYSTDIFRHRIPDLQNCVRYLPTEVAESIAELMAKAQVVRSRINAFYKWELSHAKEREASLKGMLLFLLDLNARTRGLYDYARAGVDIRSLVSREHLYSAFENMNKYSPPGEMLEDMKETIDAGFGSSSVRQLDAGDLST